MNESSETPPDTQEKSRLLQIEEEYVKKPVNTEEEEEEDREWE